MKVYIVEMTTLASIGNPPAMPLGVALPKGLLGKPNKSRRIRFKMLGKKSKNESTIDFVEKKIRKKSTKRKRKHKQRVHGINDPMSSFHAYVNRLTASDIGAPEHAISRIGRRR